MAPNWWVTETCSLGMFDERKDLQALCGRVAALTGLSLHTELNGKLGRVLRQTWHCATRHVVRVHGSRRSASGWRVRPRYRDLYPESHMTDRVALANRAAAHLALHQYDAALSDSERAVEVAPAWPKACLHKAQPGFDWTWKTADALDTLLHGQKLCSSCGVAKEKIEVLMPTLLAERAARVCAGVIHRPGAACTNVRSVACVTLWHLRSKNFCSAHAVFKLCAFCCTEHRDKDLFEHGGVCEQLKDISARKKSVEPRHYVEWPDTTSPKMCVILGQFPRSYSSRDDLAEDMGRLICIECHKCGLTLSKRAEAQAGTLRCLSSARRDLTSRDLLD